jgi:hypothetical protein
MIAKRTKRKSSLKSVMCGTFLNDLAVFAALRCGCAIRTIRTDYRGM